MSRDIVWRPDQRMVLDFLAERDRAAVWAPGGSGKTAMAATWLDWHLNDRLTVGRGLIVAPPLVAKDGWPHQIRAWRHLSGLQDLRVLGAEDFGLTKAMLASWTDEGGKTRAKRVPHQAVQAGQDGGLEVKGAVSARSVAQAVQEGRQIDLRGSSHTFVDKAATKRHLQHLTERLHIVPWTFWDWLVQAYGRNFPYAAVVFDEASFLRDPASGRYRAAEHALFRTGAVSHVLELTASPAANKEEATYAQLDLVQRGLLGDTLTQFRDTYCVPATKNWSTGRVYTWKVAEAQRGAFNAKCAEVAVSTPSTLDVPLVHVEHWVELPEPAREAYRSLDEDMVWGEIVCGDAAVKHSKLRQIATGFVYTGARLQDEEETPVVPLHDEKIARLAELVESIDAPVIVAFEFKEELRRLKAAFGRKLRDIREKDAKADFLAGKFPMLAIHPASAGHGVDGLQDVCCNVVWFTVTQDRELFDQLNWRVHRHGTVAPTVYCHALIARDTVERGVWQEALPEKRAREDRLLEATRMAA